MNPMKHAESHHDSQHHMVISEEQPSAKSSGFLLICGLLVALLFPVLAGLLLLPSASATENEDAARAAIRTKNLTELQAADAAESSF